jgi:uncharacterized Zn-binding protein involved in type VI secretion
MALIARLGDSSSHGGSIITCSAVTKTEGVLTARVGDFHSCPIPGHGITPIVNGSGNFKTEGKITAVYGSIAGCGAIIYGGSTVSNAPLESPSGSGRFGGPLVLGGPNTPTDKSFILG